MALNPVKNWVANEVLYAADLVAEFANILNNPTSLVSPWTANLAAGGFDLTGIGELAFGDEAANPTATHRWARSGDTLAYRVEDSRTATVLNMLALMATTAGVPAAGIGTGLRFDAESADENPSQFGALHFAASDIGAGTEDTYLSILLRVAGRALDEKYRFQSQAGDGFAAIFTHANTADRTYTLPDASQTIGATESGTWVDVGPTGTGARAKTTVYQNTSGRKRRVDLSFTGSMAANTEGALEVGSANPPTLSPGNAGQVTALSGGITGTMRWDLTDEVPDTHYYRLREVAGTITLSNWHELDE